MVSVGSVRFQIAPHSSLHFSISTAPSSVVGVIYRDFNLLHWSLLKRFPLFGFCLPVSSVPNIHPDTGGRRWSLVQVAGSTTLRGGTGAALRVYAAQAPGCSIWSVPCAVRGSSPRVFHKTADSAPPAFCAFPSPSSSGSQELDGRTLPGCSAPSPLCSPSLSFRQRLRCSGVCAPVSSRDPPGGCQPSRISGSLWLETGGLFAVR